MRNSKGENNAMDYSIYFRVLTNEFYDQFQKVIIVLVILVVGLIGMVYQAIVKKAGKIEWIFVSIVIPLLIIVVLSGLINNLKDLAYVKNGKYLVGTGTAITDDSRKTKDLPGRTVRFQLDDGEVIKIHLYYGPIYEGDRFEIIYLPNTRGAVIVRKLEDTPK